MTDEDDILAAEFALGLLDAADGEAARVRAQSDAALSLRIAWWRDQLAPLAREVEVAPPPGVWTRIARQLPDNDNAPVLVQRWRTAALAAMSVAAALALFVGTRPPISVPVPLPVEAPSEPMIATLSDPKNPAIVTVSYDAASGRLTVAPAALAIGQGDAELWIIPADGKPRSLGVIDAAVPRAHTVPADSRGFVSPGATFAISIEVKGGSPSGTPAGPVVAAGKIIRV